MGKTRKKRRTLNACNRNHNHVSFYANLANLRSTGPIILGSNSLLVEQADIGHSID